MKQGRAATSGEGPAADTTIPTGARPVIDSLSMSMDLNASYHQTELVVYTRYQVTCVGRIAFRSAGGPDPVLLFVPFPDGAVEARDVDLTLTNAADRQAVVPTRLVYRRDGIYCVVPPDPARVYAADVKFTALGRDRFDYRLPPAQQLRDVRLGLNVTGGPAVTVPDDALQPTTPTTAGTSEFRWDARSLVTDRRITLLIPEELAPASRVLYLWRFVAVAVALFGAGFLYLSELVRPGQLDRFRLGHFLLLAVTFCLFFVILTVLEFHGDLGTAAAMAVAGVASLPLLVLHVAAVLGWRFALTWVAPLAAFAIGLVVNGVYGGDRRDYVFVGAAVVVVTFVTATFPGWSAGRSAHRREANRAYAAARSEASDLVTHDLGRRLADLKAADARAAPSQAGPDWARVQLARLPVAGLAEAHEALRQRAVNLPTERDWLLGELLPNLRRDAEDLRTRIDAAAADLAAVPTTESAPPTPESHHCAACGRGVPRAAFCPECGARQATTSICGQCGATTVVPVHLLAGGTVPLLHCTACGASLPVNRRWAGTLFGSMVNSTT